MSNFQRKFQDWQEKMSRKPEKDKHIYALTISLLITSIVLFFVVSSWYFRISGEDFDVSLFTHLESIIRQQLDVIENTKEVISSTKDKILN